MNYFAIFPLPSILQVLLGLLVATAAYYDLRWRRIPNWLVLTGILAGVGLNSFLNQPLMNVRTSLLGLGLGFIVYFPLYLIRGMGAGDVKLMAAVGALTGPGNWLFIFVLTAITGGLVAIVLIALRGRLRTTLVNVAWILQHVASFRAPYADHPELDVKSSQAVTLPHGAMIALGSVEFLIAAAVWAPR